MARAIGSVRRADPQIQLQQQVPGELARAARVFQLLDGVNQAARVPTGAAVSREGEAYEHGECDHQTVQA